jgi:hypothetical protein
MSSRLSPNALHNTVYSLMPANCQLSQRLDRGLNHHHRAIIDLDAPIKSR